LNASNTVRSQIEEIVREELGLEGPIPEGDLSAELDSIQRLTLAVAIEDHFEICLDPEEDESLRTIAELAGAVENRLGAADAR
jgi:acyl carrier protein